MKPNLNRFAAILLFASAAIICSLTMWATPTVTGLPAPLGKTGAIGEAPKVGASHSPFGTVTHCVGADPAQIVFPFADDYSCVGLGAVPGLPNPYGGLTFKYDDPNTLLIGGANSSAGRIYQVGVIRDAKMHITGFSGTARVYPIAQAAIGQFNDGGVAFGPQNVLFVTRYPVNQIEQSKVGSSAPDKVVDLSPLGVGASTGSIGFVPPGFPGAGSMKIVSFTGGGWYHADFVPDGSGTFDITAASLRANIVGGPEGIAFVPPGSPVFPSNSVLIALYGLGKVVTAPLDANGDPILAKAQDVLEQLGHADGACIDPVTGDFLVGSFNAQGQLIRVSGFEAPTPTSTATVTPTPPASATATPRATATAKTTRDTTSVAALVSITLNPGNLTGGPNRNSTGTVTLSAAAPAGGAVVALTSSNTNAATVPVSVTVAAGATTATFTVATRTVTVGTIAMITATYDGISKQVGLVVNTLLGSLTFNPSVLIGGADSTGTVTLNSAAPAGGAVVTLTSSNTNAVP